MAELAGFDVIVEIHRDTVVDFVNMVPIPMPSGDDIRLLGGPFSAELSLNVPQAGTTTLSAIVDITLEPVVHQSLVRLVAKLRSGSCTLLGRHIDHVAGSLTLNVPLSCQLLPGAMADAPSQVVLQTPAAVACQLDPVTQAKVEAVLPPARVDAFCNALALAVRQLIGPRIPLPAPLLKIVPDVDSADPLQLSSVPVVAWIDGATLGVFGYYRAFASGGSIAGKQHGDLGQPGAEFMYEVPGADPVADTRRCAILLSPDAAHRVLLCPLIRNSVVRSLRIAQERQSTAENIFSHQYWPLLQQKTNERVQRYEQQELANDEPTFADLLSGGSRQERAHDRAVERVQAEEVSIQQEVMAEIEEKANDLVDVWVDSGAAEPFISIAVPPPCGTGKVQAFRKHVNEATVQSEFITGWLREFDIRLNDGRFTASYAADAFVEDILGDATPRASGEIDLTVNVSWDGLISAHATALPPTVSVKATGLTGLLMDILRGLVPSAWSVMLTFVEFLLQDALQHILDQTLGQQNAIVSTSLRVPEVAAQAKDVQIASDSLALIGLIARRPSFNTFSPALLLTVDRSLTVSTQAPLEVEWDLPATEWGCEAATFNGRRVFWDTQIHVKARPRDLALPLTMNRWTIEIGNFTLNSIAHFSVPDPRPRWSGSPAAIGSGAMQLSGVVNHPDAPITDIEGGAFPLGHLTLSSGIEVRARGSDDSGWSLGFRGTDGNFFVRISLDAMDGDGIERHAETLVVIRGDELQVPSAYTQYKTLCDARYKAYSRLKHALAPPLRERVEVKPGEDVSAFREAAMEAGRLIRSGHPRALAKIEAIERRYGTSALRSLPAALHDPSQGRRTRRNE